MSSFKNSRFAAVATGVAAALAGGAVLLAWHLWRRRSSSSSHSALAGAGGGANKKRVVFVLGGPGSGKGTQCERLSAKYHYEHLSAGDLLRAERKKDTETARQINSCISEGRLVPSEITTGLLAAAIAASESSCFIIDGFPRNMGNYRCWNEMMASSCELAFVLYFDCPEEVTVARLMKRGETSGRADDKADVIKARFRTEAQETKPIVEMFRAAGKIRSVDANRSVEDVFADASLHFDLLA